MNENDIIERPLAGTAKKCLLKSQHFIIFDPFLITYTVFFFDHFS